MRSNVINVMMMAFIAVVFGMAGCGGGGGDPSKTAATPATEPVTTPVTELAPAVFNIARVARNGMIVTLTSATISKDGSNDVYTFNYTQKNVTSGTLDEVRMKFYFTDATSMPQDGSFGTLVPGESKQKSYSFTVPSTKKPSILEFDHDNAFALIPVPGSIQIPWS
ncbi:MAG: hypothetical protein PHH91_09055 [Desulfuromonadaceae bacterium]|nr:hypothetical protein [Desulfuromonadaceae bacterium]